MNCQKPVEKVMNGEGEERDSRAELFEAIGHPTRIRILQVLNEKPRGFADLKRALGIVSNGNMAFHLDKLRNLVRSLPNGDYALTDDGKEALWSIGTISGTRDIYGAEIHVRRRGKNQRRVLIALVIVALLGLSSAIVIQEGQITAEQGQISSAQQEIGLYVREVQPFVSGQDASLVLGQGGYTSYQSLAFEVWQGNGGQTGHASASGLNSPMQTLFDKSGYLWVVDSGANRILRFNPPFSSGMSASIEIGQANFTTVEDSPTSADRLGQYASGTGPSGAAFDPSGDLWVADSPNNRVLEFSPPFTSGMVASHVLGQRNMTSSQIPLVATPRGFFVPTKVAFGSGGAMWVLDSGNNRVLEFEPPFTDGMSASLVIGQRNFIANSPSSGSSGMNPGLGDLDVDPQGNLWVGDSLNARILQFKPPFANGMNASLVLDQPGSAGSRTSVPAGTNSPLDGVQGTWNFGFAIASDAAGNLWASYNSRMLEFHPPFLGNALPAIEIGQPDLTSTSWVGGKGGLYLPAHPAFDTTGNLWVPDGGNNRILEFKAAYPTPGALQTAASIQTLGQFEFWALIVSTVAGVSALSMAILRRRKGPSGID